MLLPRATKRSAKRSLSKNPLTSETTVPPVSMRRWVKVVMHAPLVVSQTTLKLKTFLEVADAVRSKADAEPQVVNTICSATRDRQDAARALAGLVDAFYIIGGKHSSNSIKLLAVCQEQCEQSFLIETEDEINPQDLSGARRVGVTAGASTPNWLIDQVVKRLHDIGAQVAA